MVYVVTNRNLCKDSFWKRMEEIASASPAGIILREKDAGETVYIEMAERLKEICQKYKVAVILNHPPKQLIECNIENKGYTAVQVSANVFHAMPEGTRKQQKIGVSVHSAEEAKEAEKMGAEFLITGHIFITSCKEGITPRGTSFLKQICQNSRIPVFGIGGINIENMNLVKEAGAKGICVMSHFMTCKNPQEELLKFRQRFETKQEQIQI